MSLLFFNDKKVSLPYEFSAKTSASKHLVYVNASNAKKYIPLCVKDTYVNINGYKYTAVMPTVHSHDGTNHLVAVNSRSVIIYTISYSMNGGTNPSSNPIAYTVETATITFATPTKTGYNSGKFTPSSIPKGSTGNKTVTASFTANTYYIRYNGNGNTSGSVPSTQTVKYDSGVVIATNSGNLAKTGYIFSGWNTNSSGTGSNIAAGATYTKPNFTSIQGYYYDLYAKWISCNIPAGTYTPSTFLNMISNYITKGGSRTCKNSFMVLVSGQPVNVPAGTTIYYTDPYPNRSSRWNTIGFGTNTTQLHNIVTSFVTYKSYIVYSQNNEESGNYSNYSITVVKGINFN